MSLYCPTTGKFAVHGSSHVLLVSSMLDSQQILVIASTPTLAPLVGAVEDESLIVIKFFSIDVGNQELTKSLLLYSIHILFLKGTKSQLCSGTGCVYFHFIFIFCKHWIKITSCWHHPALIYCYAARPGRVSVQPQSDRKTSGAVGDKGLAQGHINGREETKQRMLSGFFFLLSDFSLAGTWIKKKKKSEQTTTRHPRCSCLLHRKTTREHDFCIDGL